MGRAADPAVRAVVVTGTPHFAAGADIGELKSAAIGADDTPLASRLSQVLLDLEALPKPTIAAVAASLWAGGWNWPWPVTSATWPRMPASASPRSSWASTPAPAARSGCRGWWASAKRGR